MHWAVCVEFAISPGAASHLIIHHVPPWETPQVQWLSFAQRNLSGIIWSENPSKDGVATHHPTVLYCRCDRQCYLTPTKYTPTAICELTILLRHIMKCIFPQGLSVWPAHCEPTRNQCSVHCSLVTTWVDFHSPVLILTTLWASKSFTIISFGAPQSFQLLCLPCGRRALNSL